MNWRMRTFSDSVDSDRSSLNGGLVDATERYIAVVLATVITLRAAVYVAGMALSDTGGSGIWHDVLAPTAGSIDLWWGMPSSHLGEALSTLLLFAVVPWTAMLIATITRPRWRRPVNVMFIWSMAAFAVIAAFTLAGLVDQDRGIDWG